MNNVKDLIVDAPLRELFWFCEGFCIAGCCGVHAFDHNATAISWWLEIVGEKGPVAKQQLDDLIADVRAHQGPVRSVREDEPDPGWPTFETEWPTSEACVAYLQTWQVEFARALTFGPRPRDPAQRLAMAAARGPQDMWREARRLCGEAGVCVNEGQLPRAIEILSAVAGYEIRDKRVASVIAYARERLAALRGATT
jgi:hypothetical protein